MPLLRSLALLALILACGCDGGGDWCPALPPEMASLAAQAASIDVLIYDATASCDGNDVAAGAPAPVSERHVGDGGDPALKLPAGGYVIVLHAYDAGGALIGSGCSVEMFTPGQRACLSVAITAPSHGGRGGVDGGLGDGGGLDDGGIIGGGGDMAGAVPFTAQTSGTTNNLYQVWYAGNNELFVVGIKGTILHTSNGGTSWQSQSSGTTLDLEAIWGSGPNDIYIVGIGGIVLHSANAGSSWQRVTVPVSNGLALWDVWGSAVNDVYLVGDRGTVLHGSGTGFSAVNIGSVSSSVNDVWGASAGDVYLFGANGLIMHGSAGGGFTKQMSGTSTDTMWYGWGSADGSDVWINSQNSAGTINNILYSGDHGGSWSNQLSTATNIAAMWSTASGRGYAVGAQILETTDHGAHWSSAALAPALLFGVGGDPSGAQGVWSVGSNGIILHRP
jgi:photosystem II stability/assembly factor-like uncharacterized protein